MNNHSCRAMGMATLAALLLTACAREDLNWLVGTPITVTATSEPTTRSGDNIQTANFDNRATINAYYKITGGDAIAKEPVILTAATADNNGRNRLTPDVQPYYPESGTVDIMALYPPERATKSISSFTVEADQQSESNYKLSDLMWAGVTTQAKTTADVALQFSHLMAKMTVTVTASENVVAKKVSLQNINRTVPISTLSPAACTLGSVSSGSDAIVLASTTATTANNTLTGTALFPGQPISGNFIKVETNFGDAYYSLTNKAFEGGKAYTAELEVKRQDIGFVTDITNWADNGGSIAVPPGSGAGLRIENIPDQAYDGTAKTPKLNITYSPNSELVKELGEDAQGSYTLVSCEDAEDGDGDYDAEYFNNVNQGTAMVIITGRKSSKRPAVLADVIAGISSMTSFKITAATGNLSYPAATKSVEYEYNATVDHALDTNGGDGTITYTSSDETVADVTNSGVVTIRKVGTTTITASMANDGNYSAASASYVLTVTPRKLKSHSTGSNPDVTVTMNATSFPYNGQAHRPAVVVKDKGRTLQENKHYTYEVANNTNVGTATITIRGMGNYSSENEDVITKTFTITPITPTITMETTAVTLAKGQKFTRRAKTNYGTVTYNVSNVNNVSNDTYATVSADGVVTAKECGSNHATQKVTVTASVAADGSNNWSGTSKSYDLYVTESNWTFTYDLENKYKYPWECPVDGVYELEAMGAQGATAGSYSGGRGADVAGQVFIKKGQKLYIYLGQGGGIRNTTAIFNGGGYYTGSTPDGNASTFACGGGATDFALNNADWDTDEHLYSRIIVAGGGGGALRYNSAYIGAGGSGGGEGETSSTDYFGEAGYAGSLPGLGGTLSAGGAITADDGNGGTATNGYPGTFGKGGNFKGTKSAGMGGGGWFGGASGSDGGRQGSGGGGSSFIYNSANLAAAKNGGFTYTLRYPTIVTSGEGNYFDASLEITPTILITGGSPDVNGQARITYKSAE